MGQNDSNPAPSTSASSVKVPAVKSNTKQPWSHLNKCKNSRRGSCKCRMFDLCHVAATVFKSYNCRTSRSVRSKLTRAERLRWVCRGTVVETWPPPARWVRLRGKLSSAVRITQRACGTDQRPRGQRATNLLLKRGKSVRKTTKFGRCPSGIQPTP